MTMNDNLGNFPQVAAESFEVFAGPPPTAEEVADAVAEADYWSAVADQLAAIRDEITERAPNSTTIGVRVRDMTNDLNRAIAAADNYAADGGRHAQGLARKRGNDA